MAARALPTDDLAFGRAVLLATDALGMSSEGAFWLYDARDREWQFYLATSLFSSMGPREIYLRLNQALAKKLSERETRRFQVFMCAPNESLVRAVRAVVTTEPYSSEPKEVAVALDHENTRAIVYRMASPADQRQVRRARRRFLAMSKELLAA